MYVSVTALETLLITKVHLKCARRSCNTIAAFFKPPPLEKQTCQRNESDNAHKRNDLHNKLVRLLLRDVYFKNLVGVQSPKTVGEGEQILKIINSLFFCTKYLKRGKFSPNTIINRCY